MNPENPSPEGQITAPEAREVRKRLSLSEILKEAAERPDLTETERQALAGLIPKILDTARSLASPKATAQTGAETTPSGPTAQASETAPAKPAEPGESMESTEPAEPGEPEKILSPEEETKRQWLEKTKELFKDPQITASLETMLKDPNLKTAQETLQFGYPGNPNTYPEKRPEYAQYDFEIEEKIKSGLTTIENIRTSSKPFDYKTQYGIVLALDPLTKLRNLPPTLKDQIDNSVKPFLERFNDLMKQSPDSTLGISDLEVYYPKGAEPFDERTMNWAGEAYDENVPYGRVSSFSEPGIYSGGAVTMRAKAVFSNGRRR